MKRRIHSLFIVLAAAMMIFACGVFVNADIVKQGSCGQGSDVITWVLDDNDVLTISGTGYMRSYNERGPWVGYRIKEVIIDEGVVNIGLHAFSHCKQVTKVSIPASVKRIGKGAFEYCESLNEVTISNGVESIDDYGFDHCSKLTSVVIPNSVESIGEHCFDYCSTLKNIVIPKSVTSIGEAAFSNCPELASISVENGNMVYDSRNNCNAIINSDRNKLIAGCKSTCIPNGVEYIGDSAFYGIKLTNIYIPDGVISIGSSAFCGSDLISINIPSGVETIGYKAFALCKIEEITLPNTVKKIGNEVFSGCTELEQIKLSNSINIIPTEAFKYCAKLSSIAIPKSVTTVYYDAFSQCTGLESIKVDNDNRVYDSRCDCNAIIETESNTMILGCKNTIIPTTVTCIDHAFVYCLGLKTITIPASVLSIKNNTFDY